MNSPKKIFLVASSDSLNGGVGTYIKDQLGILKNTKIVTGDISADIYINGLKQIPSPYCVIKFISFVRENSNSIFIFHSSAGLLLSIISKLFAFVRFKSIVVYHGLASNYQGFLAYVVEYISNKLSDKSVFMNMEDQVTLNSSKKKSIYIPNFSKISSKSTPNIEDPIVTVTRNSLQKDNSTFIEFASNTHHDIHLFTNEKDIKYFEEFNLNNLHVGSTRQKDEIYSNKSIFVLSTFSEGFPLSILEACSYGLPIICSNIPILKGLLENNVLYFDSSTDLIKIVQDLKKNEIKFNEYSANSIKISKKFSLKKWKENWLELIDNI